ncbi:26S proteasome regulatory subunit N3 [Cryptococcus wingfieldii CBS 7118]|uniref:26S proteasome regulatory subunit N3 n=1 Tax=Cryptococcus wingfieldii CBS 7118 TaxID=1295528 RepID=A0A1E3K7R6_9TREE|nr:26S proteasome regulatory subunit N3 [Cryptococcus wingfieldii CBS 7118]ODO08966.1 26S proteasome regulatory subunit N3 [Cryptococcus wingfieldii CBS 7118]
MANETPKTTEAPVKDGEKKEVEEKKEVAPPPPPSVKEEILNNISLIGRAVTTIEPRFTVRVLRTLTSLRKKAGKEDLREVLNQAFPKGSKTGQALIASPIFSGLPEDPAPEASTEEESMDVDASPFTEATTEPAAPGTTTPAPTPTPKKKFSPPLDSSSSDLIPEGVVYLRLLLLLKNLDAGNVKEAGEFAEETAELVSSWNRRTMDAIAGKVWFYLARAYELQGRLSELQPQLLAVRQTASLRKDETLEVTVLNLLLRSYLSAKQYEQAEKLVSKASFDGAANQAQTVRWLFYKGRLRAIQLNYAEARNYLQTAIRRAPKDEVAPGFVQLIHKYFIIVVLLTGVIPDRALFRKPILKNALHPYFQIVQAVRSGSVPDFQAAFQAHEATFLADQTHFLILRLRHFVIKTALRTITLAYSKISLADVCIKLGLDSEEDTEYIVAKAIKDGVIEALINPQGGYMESKVAKDVYETDEPQKQFTKRVQYCTTVYNESVRAMRYPPNAHRKELDSAAESRERDREIAQLIQESEEPDDMDDMGDL